MSPVFLTFLFVAFCCSIVLKSLNTTESARLSGYKETESNLAMCGHSNYIKLKDRIKKYFDEIGLSDAQIKKKIIEGMEAHEQKVHFDSENGWQYSKPMINWTARFKFLELAAKIRGMLKVGFDAEDVSELVKAIASARGRIKRSES